MSIMDTRQPRQRSSVLLTGEARYGDRIDPIRIRNLSEGGAMLESADANVPDIGARGELVRKGNAIPFSVKWTHDTRYGIEFDEPIDEQEMLIQIGKIERQKQDKPRFRRPGLMEKRR